MNYKRIRQIRRMRDLSGEEVSKKLGISAQYYYNIERGRRKLSAENAVKLADVFEVPLDYLLGQSISALIESRLSELNMTYKDLAKLTELPEIFLSSLDTVPPQPWDYEKGEILDKISKALKIDFKTLAAAYSRQEPPAYDGSTESVEEAFANEDFTEYLPVKFNAEYDTGKLKEEVAIYKTADKSLKQIGTNIVDVVEKELTEDQILTMAAHSIGHVGKLTDEQLAQIRLAVKIALAKDSN